MSTTNSILAMVASRALSSADSSAFTTAQPTREAGLPWHPRGGPALATDRNHRLRWTEERCRGGIVADRTNVLGASTNDQTGRTAAGTRAAHRQRDLSVADHRCGWRGKGPECPG